MGIIILIATNIAIISIASIISDRRITLHLNNSYQIEGTLEDVKYPDRILNSTPCRTYEYYPDISYATRKEMWDTPIGIKYPDQESSPRLNTNKFITANGKKYYAPQWQNNFSAFIFNFGNCD